MSDGRFLNPAQPQTLQIAVFLLYLNGALAFITLLLGGILYTLLVSLALMVAQPLAAYGIANERRWGYILGIVMAVAPFLANIVYFHTVFAGSILNLLFEVALVALLVHPQSRDYQRIWFK